MKITFISNFMNHYQLPFAKALSESNDIDYCFIATAPLAQDRLKLGFEDMNCQYPFILRSYDSRVSYDLCLARAYESDVVIIGSAPEDFIRKRITENKLTFRYSERLFKRGIWQLLWPRVAYTDFTRHTIARHRNIHMLCASAFTSLDCSLIHAYPANRMYKWGYFPEVKRYDHLETMLSRKNPSSLLWAARLIKWKHPEVPILIAKRLKEAGYSFELNLIGCGEMELQLKRMVHDNGLEDCVHMLGAMSPEAVREYMEKAGIYLFTSDFNEGWGVVLNESMNSGCAVVASHAIGAVPFLVEHQKSGIIYKNGDINDLYKKVAYLLDNPGEQAQIGEEAYRTITEMWNAEIATARFVKLVEEIQRHGECNLFDEGPCSKAEILKNSWFMDK